MSFVIDDFLSHLILVIFLHSNGLKGLEHGLGGGRKASLLFGAGLIFELFKEFLLPLVELPLSVFVEYLLHGVDFLMFFRRLNLHDVDL